MKKVLLTGASGFVGRHCLPALRSRGFEVHALSSKETASVAIAGVHWHHADLLDQAQVASLLAALRPTHLLHSAWYAVPGKYWEAPENFRWVEASAHLFKTFVEAGGRRVVGVGSCAEYDWKDGCCSEQSTPLNPTTTYGVCKHTLQLRLATLAEETGLSAAWGRIFFLYGPYEYQERLVASIISALLREQPAPCSHGDQVRDFLYVADAADALVALLDSEVSGAVNIASGVPLRLHELINQIAAYLERADLIQFGARATPASEPPVLVAEVGRLRNEVGWTPQHSLAQGLAETIEWWKLQLAK
ncbi:MAG TPA: NAD(P)-dependent oxidoreductase [Pyrinomonadaceae bacterium]|jgi:nucleoside-diphosphate-sugar epimerase|nr:NAD(P)-dependent oxidoreductase [Pyrinomonadaceae bacterium]